MVYLCIIYKPVLGIQVKLQPKGDKEIQAEEIFYYNTKRGRFAKVRNSHKQ